MSNAVAVTHAPKASRLDVDATVGKANEALELLTQAACAANEGKDWRPLLDASSGRTKDVLSALNAFFEGRPVLTDRDRVDTKRLRDSLEPIVGVVEKAGESLELNLAKSIEARGGVAARNNQIKAYNEAMLAEELVDLADRANQPVYFDYFGKTMVAEPGDAASKAARVATARRDWENRPSHVERFLSGTIQQADRRIEISEAQSAPVRTREQILEQGRMRAIDAGYKRRDGSAQKMASIGFVIQDLMNHEEINAFAPHLFSLALDSDGIKEVASGPEKIARARERADAWVAHFGRGDEAIDGVWYAAIDEEATRLSHGA